MRYFSVENTFKYNKDVSNVDYERFEIYRIGYLI